MRPADSMYLTVGIELKYGQMFLITTHAELKYKKKQFSFYNLLLGGTKVGKYNTVTTYL